MRKGTVVAGRDDRRQRLDAAQYLRRVEGEEARADERSELSADLRTNCGRRAGDLDLRDRERRGLAGGEIRAGSDREQADPDGERAARRQETARNGAHGALTCSAERR